MIKLIIVGAGGLARDLYGWLKSCPLNGVAIKGFLVDEIEAYNQMDIGEEYLGKIDEYAIEDSDRFLIAIGENPGRKKIINLLMSKNAKFFTYIHQSAIIHYDAIVEEGCIIGPFSIIGSTVKLGKHAFLNKYCNIGHGSVIGDGLIMYPYSMIGGEAKIGKNFVISTRSTVLPRLVIGDNCTISYNVFLEKNSDSDMLYFNKNTQTNGLKLSYDNATQGRD